MIALRDVHKRYRTQRGAGHWVLQGIDLDIPSNRSVALIGANGVGKSTLLRLIGGIDTPTRGQVERDCTVSWPLGLVGGLQGALSGRQNAKFVCRINGGEQEIEDKLAFIAAFSELGDAFDDPVNIYSSGMQGRLKFAISMAFRFDVYLVDELMSVGDAAFRIKAKAAFQRLAGSSTLIMVSHAERVLREFCESGIWLRNGQAMWFDRLDEALKNYKESIQA
jgi:capsular polysaccharide transport system ATP-binding protein